MRISPGKLNEDGAQVADVSDVESFIFKPWTRVAAQPNAPAPSKVDESVDDSRYTNNHTYKYTWNPNEQEALRAIIAEWSLSNSDIKSILGGWSEIDVKPCDDVWQGIVCTIQFAGTSNNSDIYNMSVVGLSITNTDLAGILPPEIGNLTNLVYITITGNKDLSGPLPKELSKLKSLQILDLHGNNFNGTIPLEYGMLENINSVQNQLTGSIPSALSNLTYLSFLQLNRNKLSGYIPGSNNDGLGLGNLSNLVSLNLMGNNLIGGLPDFRKLPELQYLNVSQNNLSGLVNLELHFNVSAKRLLRSLDLSFNSFTGPVPNLAQHFNTLQQLHLSNNKFDASELPPWLENCINLTSLRLANISLYGTVPDFFFSSPRLQYLQLGQNNLEGLLNLRYLKAGNTSLKWVDLTKNKITKVENIDPNLLKGKQGQVRFMLDFNPCCDDWKLQNMTLERNFFCRDYTSVIVVRNTDRTRTVIISVAVSVSGALLLIAVAAIAFYWRIRRVRQLCYQQVQEEFAKKNIQPTLYAYSELKSITREFHPDNKLGEGAFGVVYKGRQRDGTLLAVKDLQGHTQQGFSEFLNEVVVITGVSHRNLVKLNGCCLKDDRRLLVYEYVENNNLADVLFDGVGGHDLNWAVRYNICLGVAQGLHYLHESTQPRIIHRDIKASNILLDKKLNAKIADFGLARLFPDEQSHLTTFSIAGTMGYMAPEYASRGQLTEKADVYSFGVLTLEIVSGRRNIDHKMRVEDIYLIELAWRLHAEGTLLELADPKMNINGHEQEVHSVINVALQCVQMTGQSRPSMARVKSMLMREIETEAVIRQSQFNKPEYASYLATMQAGSDFTMTTIPERDERDEIVEDEKPLLIHPGSTSASASILSSSDSSRVVELSAVRPR